MKLSFKLEKDTEYVLDNISIHLYVVLKCGRAHFSFFSSLSIGLMMLILHGNFIFYLGFVNIFPRKCFPVSIF